MNSPGTGDPVCRVSGADKLPADVSASTLCKAIETALVEAAVKEPVTVDVTVRSRYSLAATIKRAGRALPELTMDVSDRAIGSGAIQHFAQSIAQAAAS
jgi:hypothetical protein